MNPIFKSQRIKLLAIRHFAENGRKGAIRMCVYFIIFAFLPRLINSSLPLTSFIIFCIILVLGGIAFTAKIFQEIHQPASGMHYLHIPASRFEKFLFNGVLTLLYYPAVCLLLYYGATFFGNLIEPIMPSFLNYSTIDISLLLPAEHINKLISQYVLIHAIFFLGSLTFKKHHTSKTFISLIVISIIIGIIQSILFKIVWADFIATSVGDSMSVTMSIENMFDLHLLPYAKWLFNGMITVFLWVVAYFKFKEKQV